MVSRTFLFIFQALLRNLGSNNFRKSSYKEKTVGSALFFHTISPFLIAMVSFTEKASGEPISGDS